MHILHKCSGSDIILLPHLFPYFILINYVGEGLNEESMYSTVCIWKSMHSYQSWFSPSTVWILEMKLESSGLVASAFTYWAI